MKNIYFFHLLTIVFFLIRGLYMIRQGLNFIIIRIYRDLGYLFGYLFAIYFGRY